ncbi:MAG: hypothetical protein GF353_00395 [Candidatus Lokiarchaeota archaeon]|nr:hypothetical protein [Candidatus Lokiarchaeota archaeon]
MGRQLNRAYDKRLIGDYGTSTIIEEKEALDLIKTGKKFIDRIIDYLEKKDFL